MNIKILFAMVWGLFVVLTFHAGVAAPLNEIPELPGNDKELVRLNCANLKEQLLKQTDGEVQQNQKLIHYLGVSAETYWSWHQELAAQEEQVVRWPVGYFLPLENSKKNLDSASDGVYGWAAQDDDFFIEVRTQIENCFADTETRMATLESLDVYTGMQSEHLSGVADFLSTMKLRLKDWLAVWFQLEGQQTTVPAGYFSSLQSESDIFRQAADLVRENAGLVSEQYTDFLQHFLALAGAAEPQVD